MKQHLLAVLAAALAGGPALATAQEQAAPEAETQATAAATETYAEPLRRLMDAADRLREATQAMAAAPEPRDEAIEDANDALLETQRAMAALPPEMMFARDPAYDETRSMDRLTQAAQKLREAVQAMAEEPPGPGRTEAINEANAALVETQEAMLQLVPEVAEP